VSEAYEPGNLLDRLSAPGTLQVHYDHLERRERALLASRFARRSGTALSVGCGWHPGRHLLPAPQWHLTGADLDPDRVRAVAEAGVADAGVAGRAGDLRLPDASFDVVLYRLVLHHVAFQGPLEPCFDEARRLLRPGGVLVAVEPGSWHPVGAGLAAANRLGLATAVHGTPDDVPLSPRALLRLSRGAGLRPELHAVTYTWRRLPASVQRRLQRLDHAGSGRGAAAFGHTLMLIARR